MKKLFKLFLVVALAAAPLALAAQNDRPEPPQRPDGAPFEMKERPEMPKMTIQQRAHMKTDQMDRLLTLTDKQYKKIYKLNLKELKEMEADSLFLGRRGMGFGPGFGPGPGMGPGGPGNRAQFERDMARSRGEFTPLSQQQMEQLKEAHEKSRLKKDKKLRKILTDEQYGKWVKAEQERLVRMRQMRDGRGRGFGPGMGPEGFRPDGQMPEGFKPDSTMGPRPGHHRHHHRPDSTGNSLPQAPGSEATPVKMVE